MSWWLGRVDYNRPFWFHFLTTQMHTHATSLLILCMIFSKFRLLNQGVRLSAIHKSILDCDIIRRQRLESSRPGDGTVDQWMGLKVFASIARQTILEWNRSIVTSVTTTTTTSSLSYQVWRQRSSKNKKGLTTRRALLWRHNSTC